MRDEPRSPSPARHQLDHAIPTVIHNPEEDMPLLARWLRRAMSNQTRFWSLVAGLVIVLTTLVVLSNGLSTGRSTSDAAWVRLETAETPSRRVEIAREYPGTQAEQWGLLQAAKEFYNQGFNDLPANRDAALPALKKALELFDEIAREAPQDSPQARAAALGAARTLEARNELAKAIKQYEKVAATWKGTPEAAQAEQLIQALRKPENVEFYKELYAYKPAEAPLPPGNENSLTLPAGGRGSMTLPTGHPPIGGPTSTTTTPPTLFSPLIPPPPASTGTGTMPAPAKGETRKDEPLPALPPPPPSPETKAEPKAESRPDADTPAAAPKDRDKAPAESPKGELPDDPFAPKQ